MIRTSTLWFDLLGVLDLERLTGSKFEDEFCRNKVVSTP